MGRGKVSSLPIVPRGLVFFPLPSLHRTQRALCGGESSWNDGVVCYSNFKIYERTVSNYNLNQTSSEKVCIVLLFLKILRKKEFEFFS